MTKPPRYCGDQLVPSDQPETGHDRCAVLHRGDESVASTVHGPDDVLPGAVVANGSAHLLDASRQVRLRHEPMPPHPIEEVVLGDHAIAVLDQVHEEIEGLRLEVDHCICATQLTTGGVDLAVREPVHHTILTAQDWPCCQRHIIRGLNEARA